MPIFTTGQMNFVAPYEDMAIKSLILDVPNSQVQQIMEACWHAKSEDEIPQFGDLEYLAHLSLDAFGTVTEQTLNYIHMVCNVVLARKATLSVSYDLKLLGHDHSGIFPIIPTTDLCIPILADGLFTGVVLEVALFEKAWQCDEEVGDCLMIAVTGGFKFSYSVVFSARHPNLIFIPAQQQSPIPFSKSIHVGMFNNVLCYVYRIADIPESEKLFIMYLKAAFNVAGSLDKTLDRLSKSQPGSSSQFVPELYTENPKPDISSGS